MPPYNLRFSTTAPVATVWSEDPDLARYLEDCARAMGLQQTTPQLRRELASAIHTCLLVRGFPSQHSSEVKRKLLCAKKAAEAAAASLRRLVDALTALGQVRLQSVLEMNEALTERNIRPIELAELNREADWLACLSRVAQEQVDAPKMADKGGRPQLRAFDTLIRQLAVVYHQTTDRKAEVTWNDLHQRYEGQFVRLVETLLPTVRNLAEKSGHNFAYPSDHPNRPQEADRLRLVGDPGVA